MKKFLFAVVLFCLLAVPAMAEDYTLEATAEWTQRSSDLPFLSHWNLYMLHESGLYVRIAEIPYTEGEGPFTHAVQESVTVSYGENKLTFYMTAVNKGGWESQPSEPYILDVPIDYPEIDSPQEFKVVFNLLIKVE